MSSANQPEVVGGCERAGQDKKMSTLAKFMTAKGSLSREDGDGAKCTTTRHSRTRTNVPVEALCKTHLHVFSVTDAACALRVSAV